YERSHGYSHFDATGAAPRFAFGHGLSYTQFGYRALRVRAGTDALQVSVAGRNTGSVAADEIVQLYVSYPGSVPDRPVKALKAFARVHLPAGATRIVALSIRRADLRWWDPATQGWRDEPGTYTLHAGGSSTDLITTTVVL
ncbi:MAG: fibronectin type III-like domain-contianing protein, partial [Polymorphobacter sp.]